MGGGLYASGGNPSLIDVVARENNATFGGGIAVQAGSITVDRSFFLGNKALEGGGIYIAGNGASPTPSFRLTNSVVAGNVADSSPGVHVEFIDAVIEYVTISGNRHPTFSVGAGLINYAQPLLLNHSIIWGNFPNQSGIEGSDIDAASSNNTIEKGHPTGVDTSIVDPMFVSPPDPGEDDLWYPNIGDNDYGNLRLLAGSPATGQGAYEGEYESFETTYPELAADEDSNNDGLDNLLAYLGPATK